MNRRKSAVDLDTEKMKSFIKYAGVKPEKISRDLNWSHDYLGQKLRIGYMPEKKLHILSEYFNVNDDFFKLHNQEQEIPKEEEKEPRQLELWIPEGPKEKSPDMELSFCDMLFGISNAIDKFADSIIEKHLKED